MATFTATDDGLFRCSIDAFETMLSQCAEVQTFFGLTPPDEAGALAAIVQNADADPANADEYTTAELAAQRPRVMVYGDPADGMAQALAAVAITNTGGMIIAQFDRTLTTPEETNPATVINAMQKTIGRTVRELWKQHWEAGGLLLSTIQGVGPWENDHDDRAKEGHRTIGEVRVFWGDLES